MAWTPFNFFKYDPDEIDFSKTTFNIKQALNNNWAHIQTLLDEIRTAVDKKVTAEEGKGLSTNDYTTAEKNKVANTPSNVNDELAKKVDKVTGKDLSTNDYTNEEKAKVANLPSNTTEELSAKAPAYTYGTEDLTAGTSPLETGTLHFVYE